MDNKVNFLITILYDDGLIRCALSVDSHDLVGDCGEYPMEPENRDRLLALLPEYVSSCGYIVDVETIFAIHCI